MSEPKTDVIGDLNETVKNQTLDQWHNDIATTLENADRCQAKARDEMKKRHEQKYPPSSYRLEEEVLVKECITGKKIRSKKGKNVYISKIKKRKGNRYQLRF